MSSSKDFTVKRTFNTSLDQAWNAWIEPAIVKQWWGPTGFTGTVADMDFRKGGTSLVAMRAPKEWGGQEMFNTWEYTDIKPKEQFVYVSRFTDKDRNQFDPVKAGLTPGIPKEVLNTNTFKDLGDGRIELTILEKGYTTQEAADLAKMGLEQCLDKMEAALRG